MSQDSYFLVEDAFLLAKSTIPALFGTAGNYSRFVEEDATTGEIKYLKVLIQGRRKLGVADCLLSLCHCHGTGWTYGFICGEGVVHPAENFNAGPLVNSILDLLNPCLHFRSHALLAPVMLLKVYCIRIEPFMYQQLNRVTELEIEIGVTSAGRAVRTRSLENWPDDVNIRNTTIGLHSAGAELFYLHQTYAWTQECLRFLCTLAADCSYNASQNATISREIRHALEYETTRIEWVGRTIETGKERVQTQLNVLYSAASQKENAIAISYSRMAQEQNEISRKDVQLNTRIATSTKRDSIAMTTFTFITALFLPGTYVSSLFSMSMFDWLPPSKEETAADGGLPSVSAKFYVYWCITVPLTVVVISGWFLWYRRADRAWQKETGYHLNGDPNVTKPCFEVH